jgi:hypothetical protein
MTRRFTAHALVGAALVLTAFATACGARRGADAGEATPTPADDAAAARDAALAGDAAVAVVLVDAASADAGGATDATSTTAASGAVSGTAFWLGPLPPASAERPLHAGDAHPRDWEGADDAEYAALEDVVISAVPVRNPAAASPPEPASWPETGTLECNGGPQCPPYVTVATGDRLALANYTRKAIAWHLVKDGRVRMTVSMFASRSDPPAVADISGLEPGVYEIIERGTTERRGWLYRAAADEIVVGPTRGNSRYSITLTPGAYRIVAWHPHLSPVEKPVDIRVRTIKRVNPVFTDKNLRP